MKNLLFFTILSILFAGQANAQTAIARIKYEQAEEAFVKNDYRTTLTKLDEAQKLLGASNPKILYLRLMASRGIIAGGKYDYDFLTAIRKDADYYLKKYSEMEGIEEKLREVYDFSEALEKLPNTKALFEQKEAEAAQRLAEWIKARPAQVSDSLMNAFRVKQCYSVQEFQAYNPGAFAGLTRQKQKGLPNGVNLVYNNFHKTNNFSTAGPFMILFNNKGLFSYAYIVQGETDAATAKKVYQSYVDPYPAEMDKQWAEKKEITKDESGGEHGYFTIKGPYTGNRGTIMIMYINSVGGAFVQISFIVQ